VSLYACMHKLEFFCSFSASSCAAHELCDLFRAVSGLTVEEWLIP
jgi:hypothetical protein